MMPNLRKTASRYFRRWFNRLRQSWKTPLTNAPMTKNAAKASRRRSSSRLVIVRVHSTPTTHDSPAGPAAQYCTSSMVGALPRHPVRRRGGTTQFVSDSSIRLVLFGIRCPSMGRGFVHLQAFVQQHGNCRVPQRHVCADGYDLGAWVSNQRGHKASHDSTGLASFGRR